MHNTSGIIYITYRGRGFTGEITIHSMEYFPIPVSHMKRLLKICQMGDAPEDIYLCELMEDLLYLQGHSAFFSHRKAKQLMDNINILQERLDRIGGHYEH